MRRLSAPLSMVVACLLFLALGLIVATLGPALPALAERTGSTLAALGAIFTALFLGNFTSQLIAGRLVDRLGHGPVLLAATLLTGLGMVGVAALPSVPQILMATMVSGMGQGSMVICLTVLVTGLFPTKSVAAQNLLNLFFGVGATAGPALAGWATRVWGSPMPPLLAGAAMMLLLSPVQPLLAAGTAPAPGQARSQAGAAILRTPLLWLLGGLILVYVGTESGVGGWTPTYLTMTAGMTQAAAALATSGFWGALTVGRALVAAVGTRVTPQQVLRTCLTVGVAGGIALALTTGRPGPSVAAILIIGLALGPVFPTTMAFTTTTFHQAPGLAGSIVVAMSAVGGMLIPWLQGQIITGAGPRAGTLVVVVGTVLMLGVITLISRATQAGGQD